MAIRSAIKAVEISKKYKLSRKTTTSGLVDASFGMDAKGFVAIMGKTGSGKSTLLNLLGSIDSPTNGYIEYMGERLDRMNRRRINMYRQKIVAFVFQEYYLIGSLTVYENIELALKLSDTDPDKIDETILEALSSVGLDGYSTRMPGQLSGGEKQRAAIARAIAKNAKILLCDEPTGNLDKETATGIMDILKHISRNRLVIVVSHDTELIKPYCDRIIRLDQGVIVEDTTLRATEAISIPADDPSFLAKKHSCFTLFGLSFANIRKNIPVIIPLIIILVAAFTVFSCLFSISEYNYNDTFVNTLQYNDVYIVPVSEYEENAIFVNDEMIMWGSQLYYENISTDDILRLQDKTSGLIPVYQSYFFNKSFQDFTYFRFTYNPRFTMNCYVSLNFTEVVVVDDFSQFHQPLRYGRYPAKDNEVVIYDYMADMMIYVDAYPEMETMEELLDNTLTDRDTGQSMKIVGILKSDYQRYEYTKDGSDSDYRFESRYLAMLQVIFATADFIPQITSFGDTVSINNVIITDDTYDNTYDDDNEYRKIIVTDDISDLNMLAVNPEMSVYIGILLSNYQVADILGIDVSEVDSDFFQNYGTINFSVYQYLNYYSWDKTTLFGPRIQLYGIYESDSLNDAVLRCYSDFDWILGHKNGTLRKSYLSLSENWDLNSQILSSFHMPQKPQSFFEDNPDYYNSDFTEYTPFTILLMDTSQFMDSVKNTGTYLGIISAAVMFIGICGYGCISIYRNRYRVGVIKSMGAANHSLMLIFSFETLFIITISYILSVISSSYILRAINQDFNSDLPFDIIFFSLNVRQYLLVFGGILIVMALSLFIPIYNLLKKTPYQIIRSGMSMS